MLDTLSNAIDGSILGAWEKHVGSPARPSEETMDQEVPPQSRGTSEFLLTLAQVADIFCGYYVVTCISMVPRWVLLWYLHANGKTIVSPPLFIANCIMSVSSLGAWL